MARITQVSEVTGKRLDAPHGTDNGAPGVATDEDSELLVRAQQGEMAAFEQLVERHQQRVFAMTARMLRSDDDAAEVVQEAFLAAYRHLKEFRAEAAFGSWVYRIASNFALMRLRHRKVAAQVEEPEGAPNFNERGSLIDDVADWSRDAEEQTLDAELRKVGSSLTLVPDGLSGASIEVYYVPYAEFASIGQAKGFQVQAVDNGSFWGFWDAEHRLTKGYVLLARDRLFGASLRHFTFEEVTQVLGLMSDSSVFTDSVFYSAGSQGGNAQSLSELDRRLLRFHYRHVQPGFGRAAFEAAFDQHFWSMP